MNKEQMKDDIERLRATAAYFKCRHKQDRDDAYKDTREAILRAVCALERVLLRTQAHPETPDQDEFDVTGGFFACMSLVKGWEHRDTREGKEELQIAYRLAKEALKGGE